MPLVSTELDAAYFEPKATGPRALIDLGAYGPINRAARSRRPAISPRRP